MALVLPRRIGIPPDFRRHSGGLSALSQTVNYSLRASGVLKAWRETRGEGIRVGVADTGSIDHVDLNKNVGLNWGARDIHGHAHHVASIIGALDNATGVVGVAPKVTLHVASALDPVNGTGSDLGIAAAIEKLLEEGVDVLNLSLGSKPGTAAKFPHTRRLIRQAHARGVVVLAASGNDALSAPCFPAEMPEVIAVGSVSRNRETSVFSNRGPEFVSYGEEILGAGPADTYWSGSGTSFATPFLSGIVALILAHHAWQGRHSTPIFRGGPQTTEDVRQHLRFLAEDLEAKGWDRETGHGIPVWKGVTPKVRARLWRFLFGWFAR